MRRRAALLGQALTLSALCGPWTGGCDFFRELESEPGAVMDTETGTDTGSGDGSGTDTEDGPCELLRDDRCRDQDTVLSCSLQDGTVSEVDCVATCGSYTNFSCVATPSGQHACWCVEPGKTKVLSCPELEECLIDCDLGTSLECADQCFSRTDTLTTRIYGALVNCAETTCQETCVEEPGQCLVCIDAALSQGAGGCSLPRAICDGDTNPEDPWG